ncbi:S8 family serine peptidase [Saccharothrix sp. NPDC042600]|uniref:S8 family serine peptidase n=1 Tax=Saccharothrix TaxID=2071 RepID=UPI0033FB86FB|nr:S8 family serine peptidase [Saccharothrix mutabilis subsp. capreolus]
MSIRRVGIQRRAAVITAVSVVALLAGAVSPTAAAGQVARSEPGGERAGGVRGQVTLVSGDKVTVVERTAGVPIAFVQPAKGRERVRFDVQRTRTELVVVPQDAVADIGSGKLDRRLFDVNLLLEQGFGDAQRGDLPLIVQGGGAQVLGTTVRRRLDAVGAVSVTQSKATATALWDARSSVGRIWLDGLRKPTLDVSVPQIGAPAAWEAGFTGKGVKVAVVDTGIDARHPDLTGKVADRRDFTGGDQPGDQMGHGTHVASTIAGTGAKSGGKHKGVAPDAALLDAKVCGDFGCTESAILSGMQWAVESGAQVVNMSLGAPDGEGLDPLEEAVNTLSAQHGALFVVAAGNSGPRGQTVGSPASADAALAVGAVDKQDRIAPFSSRGPRTGDRAVKPEITAPGVAITAAKAGGGGEPAPGGYVAASGTSMAAPHVAGAAAILVGQRPKLSPAQYKALLMGSATPNPALTVPDQGAGRVDVKRATAQSVHADPPALSLGTALWPHEDDPKTTKNLTYRNPGSQPVTFTLAVTATGPAGTPAPKGMFSLSTDRVTVPAGAAATVELTADTTLDTPDGDYGGHVTATAEGQAVVTPFAVHKEAESHDLTLSALGRDGAPSPFQALLINAASGEPVYAWAPNGTTTRRLPKGDYHLTAAASTGWQAGDPLSVFFRPSALSMTKNQSVALDARQAKPVAVTIDKPGLAQTTAQVGGWWTTGDQTTGAFVITRDFENLFTAQSGPDAPVDAFTAVIAAHHLAGTEPHNLAWTRSGRMFDGLAEVLAGRDFASVRTDYHLTKAGAVGLKVATPVRGRRPVAFGMAGVVDKPGTRTEHYHGDGLTWAGEYLQAPRPDDYVNFVSSNVPVRYEPGRTYRESWNKAVLGPSLPGGLTSVVRDGNRITGSQSLVGDGADRRGGALFDSGRTSLFRDGVKVGDSPRPDHGSWDVPADEATYRLESEQKHSAFDFSTHIRLAQTFRSRHTDTTTALPVSVIRYTPDVDVDNRAPAGRLFRLPIQAQTQSSARVLRLELSVSHDDGMTWHKAHAVPTGIAKWTAHLRHPAGPGFVSLKATAVDHRGGTTEQTIMRAYGLK